MEITTKTKIIICTVSLAATFAAGRYLTPEKVRTEIKTVEVEKKTTDKTKDTKKDNHKKIVKTETDKPDGTKTITTVTTDDSSSDTKATDKQKDNVNTQSDSVIEKSRSSDKVTISALGGFDVKSGNPIWGASINKPILGPLTVGAFGLSNLSFGASVGLSF